MKEAEIANHRKCLIEATVRDIEGLAGGDSLRTHPLCVCAMPLTIATAELTGTLLEMTAYGEFLAPW